MQNQAINVCCLATEAELSALRTQIDSLNLASARPGPFSTLAFIENYLRHKPLAACSSLWFLAAFIGDTLVGYLPLKRSVKKILGLAETKVECLLTHDCDRPRLVAAPAQEAAVAEAFYRYLFSRRREWGMLEFQQQDATSSLLPPPIPLRACVLRPWPGAESAAIAIRWSTLDGYFKDLSKKFRSNVSRQMRTLLAAGKVEVISSADPAVTPALLALYRSIEPRSWKSQAAAGIGDAPQRVAYFHGLLQPQQPMQLSIHILLLDGVPIAGLITGRFEKRLYALYIVYDKNLQKLAPGSAILLLGVRQAITESCSVLDLLSGFGYYKHRWLAEMTPAREVQIYRIGSLPHCKRVLGDWRRAFTNRRKALVPNAFNPARREVEEHAQDDAESPLVLPSLSRQELQRIEGLIALIQDGRGEYLSSQALAAVMPFATTRPTPSATHTVGIADDCLRYSDAACSQKLAEQHPQALNGQHI